jgi:hypothetical protein
MDGITTGTRLESRNPPYSSVLLARRELFPHIADRIRRKNWTRRLKNKYNKNKRESEESFTSPFFSWYLGTAPLCPIFPLFSTSPTPACSRPAHGSWKNYGLP